MLIWVNTHRGMCVSMRETERNGGADVVPVSVCISAHSCTYF